MYYPEGMKARVGPVQWSKPNSILAPSSPPSQDSNSGGRIQNHKRWPLTLPLHYQGPQFDFTRSIFQRMYYYYYILKFQLNIFSIPRCPNLKYLTLDFSNAMQLHDFNDMNAFPCNLRNLTICLSEVIFMEGFMRKVYQHLSSLEVLHLIGIWTPNYIN